MSTSPQGRRARVRKLLAGRADLEARRETLRALGRRALAAIDRRFGGLPARIDVDRHVARVRRGITVHPRAAALAGLGVLGLGVVLVRAVFLGRSFDVFIDEVTYLILSQNVATGQGVTLSGKPFFLHPPLFFFVEAPFALLLDQTRLLIDQIELVRFLNVALAGVTGVTLFGIGRYVAGWRFGAIALAFYAIDAFIIKINSRNLLETSAMLWIALGYLVLVRITAREWRAPRLRDVILVGVLFGLALLTKEMTAVLTLLPLGIAFLTSWFMPRRSAAAMGAVALLTYSVYPLSIIASGQGEPFLAQKLEGVLRFLGVMKTTGFVHGEGPSFIDAVIRNLDVFATTYALIGLGIPAFLVLLASRNRQRRLLGVLGGSAYALLAYSISLGTLEEQFFYFLVVPAFLSVPIAWASVFAARPDLGVLTSIAGRIPHRVRTAARRLSVVALAGSLGWSSVVWLGVHFTPDNGYEQLLAYLRRNVPNGAAIAVTSEPGEFLLQGYVLEKLTTRDAIARSTVDYAVVATKQIEDEYLKDGEALYGWVVTHGQREFVAPGRTYGRIELYSLRRDVALVNDNFDTAPLDRALAAPWQVSGSGTAVVITEPGTQGRTAHLQATAGGAVSSCLPLPASGLAHLEVGLDLRFDAAPVPGRLLRLTAGPADAASVAVDAGGTVHAEADANGAAITTPPSLGDGRIAAGTWYRVALNLDATAHSFLWQVETTAGSPATIVARGEAPLSVADDPIDRVCLDLHAGATASLMSVDDVLVSR